MTEVRRRNYCECGKEWEEEYWRDGLLRCVRGKDKNHECEADALLSRNASSR